MASETTKTVAAPKSETVTKKQPEAKKKDAADTTKAEATEKAADVPSSYSRGEGQKPVSQAYKDNWNAIFGTKKKKKKR